MQFGTVASIAGIKSNVWGISHLGYGVVLEGLAQIRQCIDVILRTSKGSDPMRPQFGSVIYKYVDAPANIAIPNIKKSIRESLAMWEKRIEVKEIKHSIKEDENIEFEIVYLLVDEGLIDKVLFDLRSGINSDASSQLIVQAFFPTNAMNFPFQISLLVNEKTVKPLPPVSGFATLGELYAWVVSNWGFLGRFDLLADRLVLFMDGEGVKSASMQIQTLPIYKYVADFPELLPGERYKTTLDISLNVVLPVMPLMQTPAQVLLFAQQNWAAAGKFFIEGMLTDGNTVFSDEFSNEFATGASMKYRLILINNLTGVTVELKIEIA